MCQVNFPRSSHIRKKWLARRVVELVIMTTLLSIIIHQFILPTVSNSMVPLQKVRGVGEGLLGNYIAIRQLHIMQL